jgi:heme/copper-type cytochrome/quinol oxidase subunit 2
MSRSKYLVWSLLGATVFVVIFAPLPNLSITPRERNFQVKASQYAYTPSNLQVNPGDRVTIELVSMDVVHGLYIDGYDVSVEADPGQTARLEFTADREGSFRMRCNVTCGAMHPFMIGKIQVGRNTLLWRALGLAGIMAAGTLAIFYDKHSSHPLKDGA